MRAIDADAFDERVRAAGGMSEEELTEDFKDGVQAVLYMLSNQPTIQPEIVRCKDCKYAEYIDDVQTLWCTECGQGRTVAPNDFCSYAEKREVTT